MFKILLSGQSAITGKESVLFRVQMEDTKEFMYGVFWRGPENIRTGTTLWFETEEQAKEIYRAQYSPDFREYLEEKDKTKFALSGQLEDTVHRTTILDLDMFRKVLREANDGIMIHLPSVQYHLEVLLVNGFVTGSDVLAGGDSFMPDELPPKGKDLLNAIDDDEVWKAVKDRSSRQSGSSISVTQFKKVVEEVKKSLSKKRIAPEDTQGESTKVKKPPSNQKYGY